jgi:hypothetical protein
MLNGRDGNESWKETILDAYLLQFNVIFGSFNSFDLEYKMNNVTEMILFMVTAMLMPLLMLNLLIAILSNAYLECLDIWPRNKFYKKMVVIQDLELLFFWNREKNGRDHF